MTAAPSPDVTSGTYVAPDHQYPSYLTVELTVTVPGSANTIGGTLTAQPQTVAVKFTTNQAQSLHLAVDGVSKYVPFTVTMVMGHVATVTAPTPEIPLRPQVHFHVVVGQEGSDPHHHRADGGAHPDGQLQEDLTQQGFPYLRRPPGPLSSVP